MYNIKESCEYLINNEDVYGGERKILNMDKLVLYTLIS